MPFVVKQTVFKGFFVLRSHKPPAILRVKNLTTRLFRIASVYFCIKTGEHPNFRRTLSSEESKTSKESSEIIIGHLFRRKSVASRRFYPVKTSLASERVGATSWTEIEDRRRYFQLSTSSKKRAEYNRFCTGYNRFVFNIFLQIPCFYFVMNVLYFLYLYRLILKS